MEHTGRGRRVGGARVQPRPGHAVLHRLGAQALLGRPRRSTCSAPGTASRRPSTAAARSARTASCAATSCWWPAATSPSAGATTAPGKVAFTDFDHTEAELAGQRDPHAADPLAGVRALARQVAASGVRQVEGDVVVNDRLFTKFRVPNGNVLITPITVNDNLVDVTIRPTRPGRPARVDWRPRSAGFTVRSAARTVARGGRRDDLARHLEGRAHRRGARNDPGRLSGPACRACRRWCRPSRSPTRRPTRARC